MVRPYGMFDVAPATILETPWPAEPRSGEQRDDRATQGDLRAYTVGDWVFVVLRVWTATCLAGGLVGAVAALLGLPLWLVVALTV